MLLLRIECLSQATRDLETIDALIAETEANLARGFAIESELLARGGINLCAGTYHYSVGVSFCSDNSYIEQERAVAIDRDSERRKLDDLMARRAEIEHLDAQAVASCST